MTDYPRKTTTARDAHWRLLIWGVPAGLLTVPAIAMRYAPDVVWTASDFVAMGLLLGVTAAMVDGVTARPWSATRKAVGTLLVLLAFLTVWALLATR